MPCNMIHIQLLPTSLHMGDRFGVASVVAQAPPCNTAYCMSLTLSFSVRCTSKLQHNHTAKRTIQSDYSDSDGMMPEWETAAALA